MPSRSSHVPRNTLRAVAWIPATVMVAVALSACSADRPGPTSPDAGLGASSQGVPFSAGLASSAWQDTARKLGAATPTFNSVNAGHSYALLGVAEYLAVQRAEAAIEGAGGRALLETDRGAVAGASVVVLSYLFNSPAQVRAFEDLVTAQANAGPGQPHPAFVAAEAIGRAVGAEIVTRAIGDGFSNDPNASTVPTGSGFWTSNTTPITIAGGQLPGVTPWFLNSASQFRLGPPPAFGSADFNSALAEIRNLSDNRDQAQTDTATFWALGVGTFAAHGYWLSRASEFIDEYNLSERDATHVYALTSATMFDAQIACWDTKLTYWLIRPWKADLAITTTTAVGKPNHPSYPSGHSCVSRSGADVLISFFPEKKAELDFLVGAAGRSRMYGGIHYRFDIDGGQRIGDAVAQFTIARDASGNSILTAH